MYYVYVENQDYSRTYIAAPSGWGRTKDGILRDGTDPHKSGPERTNIPDEKYMFKSLLTAKKQAGKVNHAVVMSEDHKVVWRSSL